VRVQHSHRDKDEELLRVKVGEENLQRREDYQRCYSRTARRATDLPEPDDVVKLKLALEGDENPAGGRRGVEAFLVNAAGRFAADSGRDTHRKQKKRLRLSVFSADTAMTCAKRQKRGSGAPSAVNTGRREESDDCRRARQGRGKQGRTEVSVHLRIEDRDEVAQRRQLLLHPRLVAEKVLLLLEGDG
jgi:hypothetical protein